jgi:SAM-dependent methyltransferase
MDIKEFKKNQEINPSRHPWEHARLKIIFSNLRPYLKTKIKTLYDVGCGDVFLLRKLAERTSNVNLLGIDIEFNDEMIAYFSENRKISLFKSIDDIGDDSLKADAITLLDVIEHIEDVDSFMAEILGSRNVKNDALIMVTVPAYNYLFVERDRWLGHFRRYNLKLLKELGEKHNLKVVELKYFFTSLFVARLLQKGVEKIKKPDISEFSGIGDYKEKKLFDFAFRSFLAIDYFIGDLFSKIGIKLPGLSCMAIYTKQE